jgi:hypothetical protein
MKNVKIKATLLIGILSIGTILASGGGSTNPCPTGNGINLGFVEEQRCVVEDCGTVFHWGGTIYSQTFAYWCCYSSDGMTLEGHFKGDAQNNDHANGNCCHYGDGGTSWWINEPHCPSTHKLSGGA